jgi:hypothetical protein
LAKLGPAAIGQPGAAQAYTKVAIGVFAKNGLDVTIQKIPRASRHRVGVHPVRRHLAAFPTRQKLWRRWHGRAWQHRLDQEAQG